MNRDYLLLFLLFTMIFISSCSTNNEENSSSSSPKAEELGITWEVVTNGLEGKNNYQGAFTITNNSQQTLGNSGWTLYFNQPPRTIDNSKTTAGASFENVNGDFYKIVPTPDFKPLASGESVTITYVANAWSIKETDAPIGLYFVFTDENGSEKTPEIASDYTIKPFASEKQYNRNTNDKYPVLDANARFAKNERVSKIASDDVQKIVPTPVKYKKGSGTITIDASFSINYQRGLENEAKQLAASLKNVLGADIAMNESEEKGDKIISLATTDLQVKGKRTEAYKLKAQGNSIEIVGSNEAGVFYGIQSLRLLFPTNVYQSSAQSFDIEQAEVEDAPRFDYRGLHLDVSRNFQTKASVLKLLDMMALYKLNKFHFHVTDDEGWRLQIDALPELTDIGSKRGHTSDESGNIYPAYGSGPFTNSLGSGYYTKADFVEILKYATERHIEVIPELDLPGHARAAIKAMEARYKRLMQEEKPIEAKEYLLNDLDDKSEYASVQGYSDNVVCACQNSTYVFIEKVVDEIQGLFEEAGAPLTTIHTGGDEVPHGVWEKSPACDELYKSNPDVNSVEDLHDYFLARFNEILIKRNLFTAGWEEIALKPEAHGSRNPIPNPAFMDKKFKAYVWNTVYGGGREDLGYKLANAGYKVVLCNAPNLYFDFSYDKAPKEPGYYWAGFVDTRRSYELTPFDVFKCGKTTTFGQPLDLEALSANMTKLTPAGMKNIEGIQGQLWSETVTKGEEMMEYYYFPKLMGLVERAWAQQPDWATIDNTEQRESALDVEWNKFANAIGQREMPRMDYLLGGINYRIPVPGAKIEDGKLMANIDFPGLSIRYTTDGSEPTASSSEYTEPVAVSGTVKLKAFSTSGRASRTSEVSPQ